MKTLKKIGLFLTVISMAATFTACSMFVSADEDDDKGKRITTLSLSQTSLTIAIGGLNMLTLSVTPASAQTSLVVTWDYDPSIVSVTADNFSAVITGFQPGTTIVRAKADGLTASCTVTVTDDAAAVQSIFPYVYMDVDMLTIAPGDTARVSAALAEGIPADINGFVFSIDKPLIASLYNEGNYLWITGQAEGEARISVRHQKAAFPYTFLVSCRAQEQSVPYITTARNIITINKSLENQGVLAVHLKNAADNPAESFTFSAVDADGLPLVDPPITIAAAANQCVITPLKTGECFVKIEHPQAFYPLQVLIRVIEQIDAVYIEPSVALVNVNGTTSETVSVQLCNLPANTEPPTDFQWTIPSNDIIDAYVYGSSTEGMGDQLWITGKKQGIVKVSVSHSLSKQAREIIIVVQNLPQEAARASTFISTSQNYIRTKAGAADTNISIYVNNAAPGAEIDLHWHIENIPADGSDNPVIAYISGTGTASSVNTRALAQIVQGRAIISPLRQGRAIITISHPQAVYQTKVLVDVLAQDAKDEPTLYLASGIPYIGLKNGESAIVDVTLSGVNKSAGDEAAISWTASSANIAIAANGAAAQITAAGSGFSRESITVTHPKALYPIEITVVRYDVESQLSGNKTLILTDRYRVLSVGGQDTLYASVLNGADNLVWNVTSGNNTIIAFSQMNNTSAGITALAEGAAAVTVSCPSLGESSTFEITVKAVNTSVIDLSRPCYLTTTDNVTVLAAGTSATIRITPINLLEHTFQDIVWSTMDTALIEIIPNGDSAHIAALAEGAAKITITHPLAANSLEIFIHIGADEVFKNTDFAYIAAQDTILLKIGGQDVVIRPVLVHTQSSATETAGFSFQVKDPAIAAVSPISTAGCVISPNTPGQTILTIAHPSAAFTKEVIVITDFEAQESPYITSSQNVITIIAGEYATAAASLVNAQSFNTAAWTWTAEAPAIAAIAANNGNTALIAGIAPGTTKITVSHQTAQHTFSFIVICIDKTDAVQNPWIKTNVNILTIKKGASAQITAEMIGGSAADAYSFAWAVADAQTVLIIPAGAAAAVRGLNAGQTSVIIRNTKHPNAYQKSILVIVEDTVQDNVYISVDSQIIKLDPAAKSGVNIKAQLVNGSAGDARNFVWWADDPKMVSLTANADTANIIPAGVSGTTHVRVKHLKAASVVDILVMVSAFDAFAFAEDAASLRAGDFVFLPMQIPALSEKATVKYESMNAAVCVITGSNAAALLAGIAQGSTIVKATLINSAGKTVESAEIPVIVAPPAPNGNKIIVNQLLALERGQSTTVQASLQGDFLPTDKHNIIWTSSDETIVSILKTAGDAAKGDAAYLTARNPGEAVVTLSLPNGPKTAVWVTVPDVKQKALSLDQSFLQLFKNEGSVAISANILNGISADYERLIWSAEKANGVQIVSISASGRNCNILPRNVGQTVVRVQTPDGLSAQCAVNVSADAFLSLDSATLRVNPKYTESVGYKLTPDSAQVNWFAQTASGNSPFDYSIDTVNKTITVKGNAPGTGAISGYITSASGAKLVSLQVFVEYTYAFAFDSPPPTEKEPNASFDIGFTVFPKDLQVAVTTSSDKLLVTNVGQNPAFPADQGRRLATFTPIGEAADVKLEFASTLPSDPTHTPIPEASAKRTINIAYDEYEINVKSAGIQAGAFSGIEGGTITLGDGEEMIFTLEIDPKSKPNAQTPLNITKTEWSPPLGVSNPDVLSSGNGGHIVLTKEEGGRIRLKHKEDYAPTTDYILISKDMLYDIQTTTTTYRYTITEKVWVGGGGGSGHYETNTYPSTKQAYDTYQSWLAASPKPPNEPSAVTRSIESTDVSTTTLFPRLGQGITGWREENPSSWASAGNHRNGYLGAVSNNDYIETAFRIYHPLFKSNTEWWTEWTEENPIVLTPEDTDTKMVTVTVRYDGNIKPYVISLDDFRKNGNYYHVQANLLRKGDGSNKHENWYTLSAQTAHKYAVPTATPYEGVSESATGTITVTYELANGKTTTCNISVAVQKRLCEAYSKDRWRYVTSAAKPDYWELK
jgi:hypothetical protein